MTHEEAQEYSLTVSWIVGTCKEGTNRWYRTIEFQTPIHDKDNNEIYIVGHGKCRNYT